MGIAKKYTPQNYVLQHGRQELSASDVEPGYANRILEALQAIQRASEGASSAYVISIIERLLRYQNLAPLTDNPMEWHYMGKQEGLAEVWQSNRCAEAFSRDGGLTYYLTSDGSTLRKIVKTYSTITKPAKEKAVS